MLAKVIDERINQDGDRGDCIALGEPALHLPHWPHWPHYRARAKADLVKHLDGQLHLRVKVHVAKPGRWAGFDARRDVEEAFTQPIGFPAARLWLKAELSVAEEMQVFAKALIISKPSP